MIYIIESLFFLFKHGIKQSIPFVLFLMLIISSISAYLVGWYADFEGIHLLYVLYTAVMLYILFSSYEGYSDLNSFEFHFKKKRLHFLEKITSIIGLVTLLLNFFILYKVFALLVINTIEADSFKNGLAEDYISVFIPYFMVTVSNLLSPLGYFFLTLHFYYLITGNKKKTLYYLMLSLVIPSNGMLLLSRSATVEYILLYAVSLFVLLPLVFRRFKKAILRAISILFGIVVLAFMIISSSRFKDGYESNFSKDAVLNPNKAPIAYSFMDYFGKWQHFSIEAMDAYKPEEKGWGLLNCSGLAVRIANRTMGKDAYNRIIDRKIDNTMGKELASTFHGVILRLIYDFGFIGAFIFIFLYSKLVRYFSPKKGKINFQTLVMMPVLLPLALLFFAGNAFASLTLDVGFIYNLIIIIFLKPHKCIRHNNSLLSTDMANNNLPVISC